MSDTSTAPSTAEKQTNSDYLLLNLNSTEIRVLRAGLEEIQRKAQRQMMNPDANCVEAGTADIINATCDSLFHRLINHTND